MNAKRVFCLVLAGVMVLGLLAMIVPYVVG